MPKANATWTVLDHGPIERLAENLWRVEGALPGMSLRRQMVVAKRSDGGLVVHNAIAMRDAEMAQLDAWGPVSFVVVPNGWHRLDCVAWKARYPKARIVAPKGARAKVAECVPVDLTYDTFESDASVRLEGLAGVKDAEGAMLVRSADGITVVLNDAMFNMPRRPRDVLGWLFTSLLGSAPGPRVSRLFRAIAVSDKRALRDEFHRFAAMPELTRLIVAHGEVARGDEAARALRRAAHYL